MTPDELKRLTDEAKAWVDAFANAHAAKTPDPQWGVNVSRAKLALLAAIDALAAQAAPAAQPVSPTAWMWQHPETGHTGFVENCTEEERRHWERVNRPRVFVCPLYASPQAAQPVAWQPIETAPMSGRGERPRWFLAYNGHHIGVCARWADEGYGETIADELDEVVVPPPTHWMPLPPPPQADGQHTKSQLKRIAAQKGEKPLRAASPQADTQPSEQAKAQE